MSYSTRSIILLAGPKNSGKNLVGSILEKHGYLSVSFAFKLKQLISFMYNLPLQRLLGLNSPDKSWREQLHPNLSSTKHSTVWSTLSISLASQFVFYNTTYSDQLSYYLSKHIYNKDFSPRTLMQTLGTEVFRSINPDCWCSLLFSSLNPHSNYVITDGRFFNEGIYTKNNDGVILYLEPINNTKTNLDVHSSEDTKGLKNIADSIIKHDYNRISLESLLSPYVSVSTAS